MNGDTAQLEMSISAKYVHVHRRDFRECEVGSLFR